LASANHRLHRWLRRTLCISIGAALRNGCVRVMASHDGFLTQCGQNHDALLTAVVVDITAV
jgi:hypothetical protein